MKPKIVNAPQHIRISIHAIIVGHMAANLIAASVPLRDVTACRNSLLSAGFGEISVDKLLNSAIASARLVNRNACPEI